MVFFFSFAFVLGAVIGSFLNVCILRLPAGESIVRPRSHCPNCGTLIHGYDNIPILSYILLRGRCRSCKVFISLLYPLVELLTGILFVACVWTFGWTLETLKAAMLVSALIVLIFTDVKFRLLPNEVTLNGIAAGLVWTFLVPLHDNTLQVLTFLVSLRTHHIDQWIRWSNVSLFNSLAGAIFGAGILLLVREVYFLVRRTEGMGLGDVKMMGMVGAFLGVKLAFLTIMVGSLLGTAFGVAGIIRHQHGTQKELPFGTFLGCAALLMTLYGGQVLQFLFP